MFLNTVLLNLTTANVSEPFRYDLKQHTLHPGKP